MVVSVFDIQPVGPEICRDRVIRADLPRADGEGHPAQHRDRLTDQALIARSAASVLGFRGLFDRGWDGFAGGQRGESGQSENGLSDHHWFTRNLCR